MSLVIGQGPGIGHGAIFGGATSPLASASSSVAAMHRGRLARVQWRRVFTIVLAAAALVAAAVTALGRAQADAPVDRGDGAVVVGSQAALREHVVAPGDTLWALASQAAPAADPRETVDRIMQLNSLQGVDVQVGTVLLIPR